MKFLIFIKQVPEIAETRFDPETRTIIRAGVKNGINAYDRRAISEAIRYKNQHGAEVIVLTMGPPQARDVLAEALAMGADAAYHIEDRRLAGSDSIVTARVLAAAAKRFDFDIILTGQHSTDSETGHVPLMLAEMLGVCCAVAVQKIEYEEVAVNVVSETDDGTVLLDLPLPAVLSTAERLIKPLKVKDFTPDMVGPEKIQKLTMEDLGLHPEDVGLKGSPTWVAGFRDESIQRESRIVDGSDPKNAAREILNLARSISKKKPPPVLPANAVHSDRELWCVVEKNSLGFRSVSTEMIGGAVNLASLRGGRVCAIVLGSPVDAEDNFILSASGADRIYRAFLQPPHPDEIVSLLCERITALQPYALFLPATSFGRSIAPRIAARLNVGLTGDCVGLEFDDEGNLAMLKPAFGGMITAPIFSRSAPQMATIRPGSLPVYSPRSGERVPVLEWTIPYNAPRMFRIVEETQDPGAEASLMDSASIVVCVGMGLGQDNVPLAFRIADALGGAVGATRRVVDNGWMQRQFQVGLTGKFISPVVYIGLGVSGRYNHIIGIQKSENIIAVNNDPSAEILKTANLGVVGDAAAIARELLALLER